MDSSLYDIVSACYTRLDDACGGSQNCRIGARACAAACLQECAAGQPAQGAAHAIIECCAACQRRCLGNVALNSPSLDAGSTLLVLAAFAVLFVLIGACILVKRRKRRVK